MNLPSSLTIKLLEVIIKKNIFFCLILGLFIGFQSCSNKPDFSEFEKELLDQITDESGGIIKLINIEKTNSEDNNVLGQKTHTIHYKAEIEFLDNCWIYVNESGSETMIENFRTYNDQPEFIPIMSYLSTNYKKGDVVDIVGSVKYLQTENGWVIQRKPRIF